MKNRYYTDDSNTLILLSLLKEFGIRKAIVSPGTTNIALVASMQYDDWFEIYSCVDERSAAYMACGMAEASNEPVILSCTGATASRNYFPGLTEAYYRKLPVLAITGSHGKDKNGHLYAQSLDRSQAPKDTLCYSTSIRTKDSAWRVTTEINKSLLELTRDGGGPVHIDLESAAYGTFNTRVLPAVRTIKRIKDCNLIPTLCGKQVAIFIGSHQLFTDKEVESLEKFCESNNSVIFIDHTSGYYGKYSVNYVLVASQDNHNTNYLQPDVLIHLGEVSGEFYTTYNLRPKETWRVSLDGEVRDRFSSLTYLFQMSVVDFFGTCINNNTKLQMSYYKNCKNLYNKVLQSIPELPFSNIWIAKQMCCRLPKGCELYMSIFNSLRSWNFFELPEGIKSHCNVGGFGIDGALSTMMGASFVNTDRIHFCVIGDLAFFYDMNCLGNRHLGHNLRIMLINNGIGTEFKNYDHPGSKWAESADLYIAAGGHFGHKSSMLVKHFVEDLGFKYLSASNKEEFMQHLDEFVITEKISTPIVFEVFTDSNTESDSLKIVRTALSDDRCFFDKIEEYGAKAVNKILKK